MLLRNTWSVFLNFAVTGVHGEAVHVELNFVLAVDGCLDGEQSQLVLERVTNNKTLAMYFNWTITKL